MRGRFLKNEKGFTGLEAAIVLIAFVTVAAVFSYVLLGAGFFTTQKSQEVVHTGVAQATSSMELVGTVIGMGNTTNNNLTAVVMTLQLAAGGKPIDMGKTVIHVIAPKDGTEAILYYAYNSSDTSSSASADATHYGTFWVTTINNEDGDSTVGEVHVDADNYLEEFEKVELYLDLQSAGFDLDPNDKFLIEIMPPKGASLPMELQVPPSVDSVMVLLQ
jgi:flagellin FlaB